jgi:hypothetical protein
MVVDYVNITPAMQVSVRVLVTGARDWRGVESESAGRIYVAQGLSLILERLFPIRRHHGVTIVDGACHTGGVDQAAHEYALLVGWETERHPAQGHPTQNFGPWPQCGPRRNEYMCSLGADVCVAFPGPGSRGTWDCLKRAAVHGIPSMTYPWTAWGTGREFL